MEDCRRQLDASNSRLVPLRRRQLDSRKQSGSKPSSHSHSRVTWPPCTAHGTRALPAYNAPYMVDSRDKGNRWGHKTVLHKPQAEVSVAETEKGTVLNGTLVLSHSKTCWRCSLAE